jgi:DNA-binding protein HU-beta
VNKSELIDTLAGRYEGNRKQAQHALDSVLDVITREVARGEKVAITGFGSFSKQVRSARTVRNPRTGETMRAKKKSVPKFTPGADLKAIVSGAKKLERLPAAQKGIDAARKAADAAQKSGAGQRATQVASKAPGGARKAAGAAKKAVGGSGGGSAKKSSASKSSASKSTAKKSSPSKSSASKKSSSAKKAPAKKSSSSANKSAAKKSSAKKSTAKKS